MSTGLAPPTFRVPRGEDFLLLSPTYQAFAYRNVDRMFATRAVKRGERVMELGRAPEIAPRYEVGGQMLGLDDYVDRNNVAGLLVIRGTDIVLERYALGLDESTRWSTMSMVKSLTSTLVGAALHEGAIRSLDDGVAEYIPELKGSAYEAVRIRDLLTMSSGVIWNEDYGDRSSHVNRYSKLLGDKAEGGVLALMSGLDKGHRPGSVYNYNSGDTYLLGRLVSCATGSTLAEYLSRAIWRRLGMEFDAFYTLEAENGQEIGGSRAGIALRDLGRFGVLLLQRGLIDSHAILPADWLDAAGRAAFVLDPADNAYGAVGYGFSWWLDEDGAMVALGFAGQCLYVNRRTGLVIVTLACHPQPPYAAAFPIDYKSERRAFKDAIVRLLQ